MNSYIKKITVHGPLACHSFLHRIATSGVKIRPVLKNSWYLFHELQGWKSFFLGARFFGCAVLLARPIGRTKEMGAQKQIARRIETQLKTLRFALYYMKSTYNPSFLMSKSFRKEGFIVWVSTLRCFLKKHFHNTNASV